MIKIFIAFVKKETFHILRDPRTLAIIFGMPIALVLIFGYTVSNEFKDASIAILDHAEDELSHELIAHLTASGHFHLVSTPQNIAELERSFENGSVKMGIVIPENFQTRFFRTGYTSLQLITDASEPNYATTLINYARRMIRDFQQEKAGNIEVPYRIEVTASMRYNPQLVSAFNFIPGVAALILMLISAMMTSLTIAKEKETGTMDLLLISPLSPFLIILGKLTPYVLLSFLNAIIVFAMGHYIFGVPIHGSLILLMILCLLYLLVSLGLGVLISTKAPDQQTAMMTSLFTLLMPTMLLSGFLFPIPSMPDLLQFLSHVVPARYFIDIQKAIMLKGVGWSGVAQPALILLIMGLVFFIASWRNFKIRYK